MSEFPCTWRPGDGKRVLGIDEAGRGCVLGSLVFGAVLVTAEGEASLASLGVRDSKRLSPKRRQALLPGIEGLALASDTLDLSPARIDAESLGVLGKEAIVTLAGKLHPDVLVLDAPVPPRGIQSWVAQVQALLEDQELGHICIVAVNKADDLFPCCSAASIVAKTRRDALLAELATTEELPLGSGYPSDPKTRRFLEAVWRRDGRFPPYVRTKWETSRRIAARGQQPLPL